MGELVEVPEFKKAAAKQVYERLENMMRKNRAEIEANPWPTIEMIQNEVLHLRNILGLISDVIEPTPIFVEPGVKKYPEPVDIREEAVTKLLKIEEIVFNELRHQADSEDSAPD